MNLSKRVPLALAGAPFDGGSHLANQIRQRLLEAQIEHADSSLGPPLTISVGVCTLPPGDAGTGAALLREADEQLYMANSCDRNQACGVMLTAT